MFVEVVLWFVLLQSFNFHQATSSSWRSGDGADESVVETQYGPVKGIVGDHFRSFKGVPFIAPPVGKLRWTAPVPPVPWSEPLQVFDYAPGCPQSCDLPPHTCPDPNDLSEDCTKLNVFTPRMVNLTSLQPVMVFLPGGHFEQGTAGCPLYDGSILVSQGQVVLVTVNYRIGFLGWLCTNTLEGNFGFLDQLMALKWVQQNIKAFGGDPSKVTLFGQSAGATSIRAHLLSPLSKGLFHQIISQSDPFPLPLRDRDDAVSFGNSFIEKLGCSDNLSCLQSKSVSDILAAQKAVEDDINLSRPIELFLPFTPTVDGNVIPYHIWDALKKGAYIKVPSIMGDVSQDALSFVYKAVDFSLSDADYEAILLFLFVEDFLSVSEEYPPYPFIGDKRPALGVLGTDYIFECSARFAEHLIYNSSSNPLYLYQWDYAINPSLWGPSYDFCYEKVCHGSELVFEFAGNEIRSFYNFTTEEETLSTSIIGYFTNFARTGNPNTGPFVTTLQWPTWDPTNLIDLHFDVPNNDLQKGLLSQKCDFWDGIDYKHGW